MKNYLVLISMSILMVACESGDQLEQKKQKLDSYNEEMSDLKDKIAGLKSEIRELDPDYLKEEASKATRVTAIPVQTGPFSHFIEVTGTVESRENVNIGTEAPGKIIDIRAKDGDFVKKGALLIQLDAQPIRKNIRGVKSQLELAETVFERRKNLWDKNVGTEIQYLEAKANKENLESQLASLQSQLAQTQVYAPFNGRVDEVFARMGQYAQPGAPLLRMVSTDKTYIRGGVSEAYMGSFEKGDTVEIEVSNLNMEFKAPISNVGAVINQDNRTFSVEVQVDKQHGLNPNMITIMKLMDDTRTNATVIPSYLIQNDNRGSYVYVIKEGRASKVYVETGFSYENKTLIEDGLTGDEQVIDDGFREVTEGAEVQVVEQTV